MGSFEHCSIALSFRRKNNSRLGCTFAIEEASAFDEIKGNVSRGRVR